MSKTKQFCETSSIFEVGNIENEAILRDFLNIPSWQHPKRCNSARILSKNRKLSAELMALYQCALRFFHSICLKYCACHEKVRPGHTKCCTCHAKSSQQTWRSDAPKCNPSREISDLTSEQLWWRCLLYCACHGNCIFTDRLQMSHACQRFCKCYKTSRFAHFWQGAESLAPATQNQHLNLQKWSDTEVLLTCWLGNALRATTEHTFWTSQLPKGFQGWCALYILTWKCASRHNGVQFFIWDLARWLRTRRFSEPAFGSSGATNHWEKYNVSRLSYLFAHPHLLSSDSFSSLIFSLLVFSSLTFPTSAFPCVHIVGSLTSKLPSISGLDVSRFCTGSLMTNILRKCLQTSIWNPAPQRNLKNHVVYV